jgi:hypothetical protein
MDALLENNIKDNSSYFWGIFSSGYEGMSFSASPSIEEISATDRGILRDLAICVAEIAELPIQEERRELWKKHNSLEFTRPMILVFPECSWEELLSEKNLQCKGQEARYYEWALRNRIYKNRHFQDDTVVERKWVVHKVIHSSGWGLEGKQIPSPQIKGAWKYDPVIKNSSDIQKLRFPKIIYDEDTTMRRLSQASDLFKDILEVKLKGVSQISYSLIGQYTNLRGLKQMMIDLFRQQKMLHDTLTLLEEGHRCILQQYVEQNLLSLNNDSAYQSSGGYGYTKELPKPGFDPEHVRPRDIWASAAAQEMAQVGPKHLAEFPLAYEKRLLERFGLNGYGCCEDLTHKLDEVFTIHNLRRISISPFADVSKCAEKLKGDYIFSWKPHPAHLVGQFDEKFIRSYIRNTIDLALEKGCVLEMILKDTHTCEFHTERFDRWANIAREEVKKIKKRNN